jgi:hypothetical protein
MVDSSFKFLLKEKDLKRISNLSPSVSVSCEANLKTDKNEQLIELKNPTKIFSLGSLKHLLTLKKLSNPFIKSVMLHSYFSLHLRFY